MNYDVTPPGKDPYLWQIARRRAGFRRHLATYLIMSTFFWALWFLTGRHSGSGIPWPVWPMLGWGIGVALDGYSAFGPRPEQDPAEAEYQKLLRQRSPNHPTP